jgi:ribosome-associated protein
MTITRSTTPSSPRLTKALRAAVSAAQDRQGLDIVVLDLKKVDAFTDYFLVCTGQNTKQIGAIADAIETAVREATGDRPTLTEGRVRSEWVIADYFSFVVHVFSRESRAFYDIEQLWANARRHEFSS